MKRTDLTSRSMLLPCLLALILASCKNVPMDMRAFQHAQEIDTDQAYLRFAQSYPDSPLALQAREIAAVRKEQEALQLFRGVESATKASSLERFIREHPDTKAATLAKIRIAEIDFSDLATKNAFKPFRSSNSTWTGFLATYAFGDYLPVPEDPALRKVYYEKVHPLILQALEELGAFRAWVGYLITYPDSEYFNAATEKIQEFLEENAGKWDGYDMLRTYLAVFDERLKRECPNRDELIATAQKALADTAKEQNTIDEYKKYLDAFPESPYREEIRVAMGHLQFSEALLQSDRASLEKLLMQYKDNEDPLAQSDIVRARKRIEQLDFEAAVKEDTPAAMYAFKGQYEKNDWANLLQAADNRLERLRTARFRQIQESKDPEAYEKFLADFPDAPERAKIEALREEAQYEKAIADGSRKAITAFLDQYPNSRFRNRALDSLEKLDYSEASSKAKSGPTTTTLAAYLQKYPRGAFRSDAEKLIAEINAHHADYMGRYQAALKSGNYTHFGEWVGSTQDNYYAGARGQQDLAVLKKKLTIQRLVEDVASTTSRTGNQRVIASVAELVEERGRAIVGVDNGARAGTGFLLTREGLILTNACLLRGVDPKKVSVVRGDTTETPTVIKISEESGPDAAVIQVPFSAEPIPLTNPGGLRGGENLICLSARENRVISSPGTFVALRNDGKVDWLIIRSDKIPVDLGGVILDPLAQGIGIVVAYDQVNPAVKESATDYVYAISVRSLLDLIKGAILEEGE